MKKLLLLLLLTSCSNQRIQEDIPLSLERKTAPTPSLQTHFFIEQGKINDAIPLLKERKDRDALHKLGLKMLQKGISQPRLEENLLTIFSIALSQNDKAFKLLEEPYRSKDLNLILAAIAAAKTYPSQKGDALLLDAAKKEIPIGSIEALATLLERKNEHALEIAEGVFLKAPDDMRPFFPELFLLEGSKEAQNLLLKLLFDPQREVATNAIKALASLQSENLKNPLLQKIQDPDPTLQEVAAFALSIIQPPEGNALLQAMVKKEGPAKLHAAKALLDNHALLEEAAKNNLFAFPLLDTSEKSKEFLRKKLKHNNGTVRINAAIALLKQRDASGKKELLQFFLAPYDDIYIYETTPGGTLHALQHHHIKEFPERLYGLLIERTKREKKALLQECIDLNEESFARIGEHLLQAEDHDFVIELCKLLAQRHSEQSLAVLEKHRNHPGCPFIRTAAELALFQINHPTSSLTKLKEFALKELKELTIETKPLFFINPTERKSHLKDKHLSLAERSMLLIEVLGTIAQSRKEEAIDTLLDAILISKDTNHPLLAALLLKSIE